MAFCTRCGARLGLPRLRRLRLGPDCGACGRRAADTCPLTAAVSTGRHRARAHLWLATAARRKRARQAAGRFPDARSQAGRSRRGGHRDCGHRARARRRRGGWLDAAQARDRPPHRRPAYLRRNSPALVRDLLPGRAVGYGVTGQRDADTGQGTVAVAPAASQQTSAPQVAAFLATYFQAINTRDYSRYSSLFAPRLRPTPQQFQNGYGSTRDSGAVLTEISPTAVGLAAAVSFTSHQQPAESATGTSCTSWDITLYLRPNGGTYRIVHAPANYHARYQAC